jgi:hypothetical protein
MPSWLKSEAGKEALSYLNQSYAMSQAKFSKVEEPDSVPIYLLDDTYKEETRWGESYKTPAGQYVYVPKVMGGYGRHIPAGDRYRALATASKARIQEHIIDTVYMTAPLRKDIREGRGYVDPRYEKRWSDSKPEYMGQVPDFPEAYNNETHKWERTSNRHADAEWSKPGNRDKSGYTIPNPETLYSRLYKRFPDRLKGRLDEVKKTLDDYYDKINSCKSRLFDSIDVRKGKIPYSGDKAMGNLRWAISYYKDMLEGLEACTKEDGSIDPVKLAEFTKGNGYRTLKGCASSINEYLASFEKYLK